MEQFEFKKSSPFKGVKPRRSIIAIVILCIYIFFFNRKNLLKIKILQKKYKQN